MLPKLHHKSPGVICVSFAIWIQKLEFFMVSKITYTESVRFQASPKHSLVYINALPLYGIWRKRLD